MNQRLWGRLIAAHLAAPLLSCSPPSPPTPPPGPSGAPPASASASAAAPSPPEADPTAGPPGLGAWAPLAKAKNKVIHAPRVWRVAPTDKGALGLARSPVGDAGCAWNGAPDESCTGFFFAPWKDGKGSPARHPVGAVGAWAPVKVSRSWDWIWPGKAGAYALETLDNKQTLAVLDGQQERLFQGPDGVRIEQIVETSAGPVAFWVTSATRKEISVRQLTSAPLTLSGTQATLGKKTNHPLALAQTARDARELLQEKLIPVVEWAAIPNMNDDGGLDKAFLMTWSEAIPPEKNSVRASPEQRRVIGLRNLSCGFSPSRPVQDASVVKRIMVQRMAREGTTLGPPREIARSQAGQESPPLRLESRPKVRERLVPDSERVELPSGLESPPEQEILAAGYDPQRQEGIVVLAQAGELVAQTIDPLGNPTGAIARLGAARPLERRAAFALGGWVVPANQGASLLMLTGPRAGTEIATRKEAPLESWHMIGGRVIPVGASAVALGIAIDDPGELENHGSWLHGAIPGDAKEITYNAWGESSASHLDAAVALEDGSLAVFSRFLPEPSMPPNFQPFGLRHVFPKNEKAKVLVEDFQGESLVIDVFKDHVLVHRADPEQPFQGVWLRSGKTATFAGTEKKTLADFQLSTGGTLVPPTTPGPALTTPAPAPGALRGCVDELAVGPRSRLLLCYQHAGARGWIATAGAHLLRF
jgi:hypothetical protein